ncbi:phasin family protein [Micromonospora mangrovi]|uniref:Polyhydroxyalkanoate synthesis regulator phasin n=2 Tax=Micromonospora TaxID=1873 RepID=A0AAU8HJU3_9ACTN
MQDAWRAYLELAMGLTEAPRKKAQDAVRRAVGQGGATAAQLQALAEELLSTGAANREALTKLVRFEVDRALGAVGLATADEVAELTRRVHELERERREAKSAGTTASATGPVSAAPAATPSTAQPPATGPVSAAPTVPAPAPTTAVAKKTVAKKAIAKKPPATVSRTPADGSPATPSRPVKKAAPRRQSPGGDG